MTLFEKRSVPPALVTLIVLIAGILFYSAYIHRYADRNFGGNLSGFLFLGNAKINCPDAWYPGLYLRSDEGYDGEFNYYIAVDPLNKKGIYQCTGGGPYRYQRILFPMAAALLSMGEMSRVPGILLTVNFCAVLLGAYFLTRSSKHFLGHGWAGLFAIFAVGTLIALTRTTTELVYSSLMIAGFYYYLAKNNFPAAALWFSASVLAKELALPAIAAAALYEIAARKSWRNACLFLIPVGVYGLWQLNVRANFGMFSFQAGVEQGGFNSFKSLSGFFQRIGQTYGAVDHISVRQLFEPLLLTAILSASALAVYCMPFRLKDFISPFQIMAPVYAAAVLAAGFYPTSHIDYWGYGRHSIELFICMIFLYFQMRKKMLLVPLALNSLLCLCLCYLLIG